MKPLCQPLLARLVPFAGGRVYAGLHVQTAPDVVGRVPAEETLRSRRPRQVDRSGVAHHGAGALHGHGHAQHPPQSRLPAQGNPLSNMNSAYQHDTRHLSSFVADLSIADYTASLFVLSNGTSHIPQCNC